MIKEEFGKYTIELFDDHGFTLNSADNKYQYEKIYKFDDSDYISSKHAIMIKDSENIISKAIFLGFGGATGIHNTLYCLAGDLFLICCGKSVFCVELPSLNLKWKSIVDDATAFQIFKLKDDFIIHGEMSISRINKFGNIIWQHYASDIFVTASGKDDFLIIDDKIFAKAWDESKYEITFEGKITRSPGKSASTADTQNCLRSASAASGIRKTLGAIPLNMLDELFSEIEISHFIKIVESICSNEYRQTLSHDEWAALQLHKGIEYKSLLEEIVPIYLFVKNWPDSNRISKICYQGKDHIDDAYLIIDNKKVGLQVTVCEKHDEYSRRQQLAKVGTSFHSDDSSQFLLRLKKTVLQKVNKSSTNTILIVFANTIIDFDDDDIALYRKSVNDYSHRFKEIWVVSNASKRIPAFKV
jgi:hypothetical protein